LLCAYRYEQLDILIRLLPVTTRWLNAACFTFASRSGVNSSPRVHAPSVGFSARHYLGLAGCRTIVICRVNLRTRTKRISWVAVIPRKPSPVCHQAATDINRASERLGVIKVVREGKASLSSAKATEFRYLLPHNANGADDDDRALEL
jgi:hypothetical protein